MHAEFCEETGILSLFIKKPGRGVCVTEESCLDGRIVVRYDNEERIAVVEVKGASTITPKITYNSRDSECFVKFEKLHDTVETLIGPCITVRTKGLAYTICGIRFISMEYNVRNYNGIPWDNVVESRNVWRDFPCMRPVKVALSVAGCHEYEGMGPHMAILDEMMSLDLHKAPDQDRIDYNENEDIIDPHPANRRGVSTGLRNHVGVGDSWDDPDIQGMDIQQLVQFVDESWKQAQKMCDLMFESSHAMIDLLRDCKKAILRIESLNPQV